MRQSLNELPARDTGLRGQRRARPCQPEKPSSPPRLERSAPLRAFRRVANVQLAASSASSGLRLPTRPGRAACASALGWLAGKEERGSTEKLWEHRPRIRGMEGEQDEHKPAEPRPRVCAARDLDAVCADGLLRRSRERQNRGPGHARASGPALVRRVTARPVPWQAGRELERPAPFRCTGPIILPDRTCNPPDRRSRGPSNQAQALRVTVESMTA